MRVPAACSNCGNIFPSGFEIENSTNISFKGCTSGPCPQCGGTGKVIDGTFDFVGNAIHVRHAPPETVRILRALQEAIKAAQEGSPAEEVIKKVAEASPEVAEQAYVLYSRGGLHMLLLFLTIIMSSCTNSTSGKLDWNLLFDQAMVAIFGSKPYPGLVPESVKQPPSGREQSEDSEKSDRNQSRNNLPQTQTETTQQPSTTSSRSPSGPSKNATEVRKPKNREIMRRKRRERRQQMQGCARSQKPVL